MNTERSASFAAIIAMAISQTLLAQTDDKPDVVTEGITLGKAAHTYEWVSSWGKLPADAPLGNTHGCMVVDRQGQIYLNTDTERAVCVFDSDGNFVRSWGEEWKGGLHGMWLRAEGDTEFLYIAHTRRGEVAKTTLDGEVIWTLGYPKAAGIYVDGKGYHPTAIVVGPNDNIYVADGYGKSWIHQFDADRKFVRSWGGRGQTPGKFSTPHGLWVDLRGDEPRLIVADRENHRLQTFDLDGELCDIVEGMFRRPCSLYQSGNDLVVADLAGRVTVLDGENRLITHLGDNPAPEQWANNGLPPEEWQDGVFVAPHSACWDAAGNMYVMDWVSAGRVTKLRRLHPPTSRPSSDK